MVRPFLQLHSSMLVDIESECRVIFTLLIVICDDAETCVPYIPERLPHPTLRWESGGKVQLPFQYFIYRPDVRQFTQLEVENL